MGESECFEAQLPISIKLHCLIYSSGILISDSFITEACPHSIHKGECPDTLSTSKMNSSDVFGSDKIDTSGRTVIPFGQEEVEHQGTCGYRLHVAGHLKGSCEEGRSLDR